MKIYPRSFLRLVMLGWLLMALPLLLAIGMAFFSLTQLSGRTTASLEQSSQAIRLAWEHEEDLGQMEKLLRQYEILLSPALLQDFDHARNEWLEYNSAFATIPFLAPLKTHAENIRHQDAAAYLLLTSGDRSKIGKAKELLGNARDSAFQLISEVHSLTDAERNAFRIRTENIQTQLMLAVGSAFLLAGMLFWYSRHVISRLIAGVEHAVIMLGNNILDQHIELEGPDDLKWIGQRLDWLRSRLHALEEERTRMLRHVSHELKTPLAALREGSSLLSEGVAGPLSPRQARIASIMQGNALRLQELIDGLLRLQHAEHIRGQIPLVPIRLDLLIKEVLSTHKLAARDKHLRFSGTLAPLTVDGSREEVITIVNNLVSNAVKFSPESATIRLSLTRDAERAVLDVMDTGPGIPADEYERIFEPFYRSAGSKNIAGAGLGLAIAREFALALRGSLDLVGSAVGAHFRTTLPLSETSR